MLCSGSWTHSLTYELASHSFTLSMYEYSGDVFSNTRVNYIMLWLECCQLSRMCTIYNGRIKHSVVYLSIKAKVSEFLT